VLKAVGEDVGEATTELMKTITPAKIESWTRSDPMDWANESFAIAEQAQTKYCIRQGAVCDHPAGKVQIDAAYVAANVPIVKEQLQKAGVRLAHLLDATLGK
jgi:S1/P1 Nuclease